MPSATVTYTTDPPGLTLSSVSVDVKGSESMTWEFSGVPSDATIIVNFGSGCPFSARGRAPSATYNAPGGAGASVTTPLAGPNTNGTYAYTVTTTDRGIPVVCEGTVVVTGNP